MHWRSTLWLVFLAASLHGCGSGGQEHAQHLARAADFYAADDLERARVEVLNALRLQPASVKASLLGAKIAVAQSEWQRAARLYSNVIAEAPANVTALTGLARIHVLSGQPEPALALTERALLASESDIAALTTHASGLALRGDYSSAMVHVSTALRLAPDDDEAIVLLAFLLERSGQGHAALDTLREGIAVNPSSQRLITALSELALTLNEVAVAVDAQRQLIALKPENAAAHHKLARLLLHDQRYDEARRELRWFLAAHPDDIIARLFLAETLTRSGEHDAARESLTAFLTEREDVPQLRLLLANLHEREGHTDAALHAYRQSMRAAGEQAVELAARTNVARILIGRQELAAARSLLDEVLQRNPRDVEGLTLSGYLHLNAGNAHRATADLRAARDGGGDGFVIPLLAQALRQQGDIESAIALLREVPRAPDRDVLLAQMSLAQGDLASADKLVAALLQDDPLMIAARELEVRLALREQRYEQAALAAQIITDVMPDDPIGHHLAARAALAQGHTDRAEQHARRALTLSPAAVEPLELAVNLMLEQSRHDDARRVLERVVDARPDHAIALWWLGRVSLSAGDGAAAAAHFEAATRAQSQWSRPWLSLARHAISRSDHAAARRWLEQGVAATGGAAALVAELASLDMARGEPADAIERYRRLLRDQPRTPALMNNLAMLLLRAERTIGDLVEARALIEQMPATEDPRLHDTRGQVLARTCAWGRAERAFRRALGADPDNAAYRLRLAATLLGQKRHGDAREQLDAIAPEQLSADEQARHATMRQVADAANDSLPCVSLEPEMTT